MSQPEKPETGLLDSMVQAALTLADREDRELEFRVSPSQPVQPCAHCGETLVEFVASVKGSAPEHVYQDGQLCLTCQRGTINMLCADGMKRYEISR